MMAARMEADVAAVCGPRGRHDPERAALRHGSERGSVTLGGLRVGVDQPRMRAADGAGELPAPAYELFSSSEILGPTGAVVRRAWLQRAGQAPWLRVAVAGHALVSAQGAAQRDRRNRPVDRHAPSFASP